MNIMRKTPIILSAFFIFVTLNRVSSFSAQMGDKFLSVPFSLGIGLVVFVASYWTQYRGNTKQSEAETDKIKSAVRFSWIVLVISVLIDGIFNLADVLSTHPATPFTVVYGLSPTLLSLLLGILQARIDALPVVRLGWSYQIGLSMRRTIKRIFDGQFRTKERTKPRPKTDKLPTNTGQHKGHNDGQNIPVFSVKRKNQLTDEMLHHLNNGHSNNVLEAIFPDVSSRTLRRWKKEAV